MECEDNGKVFVDGKLGWHGSRVIVVMIMNIIPAAWVYHLQS